MESLIPAKSAGRCSTAMQKQSVLIVGQNMKEVMTDGREIGGCGLHGSELCT